jgi:predicted TIM-barrel fold metal-dependent hydrolase
MPTFIENPPSRIARGIGKIITFSTRPRHSFTLLDRSNDQRSMKIDCHTHLFPGKYLKELQRLNIPLGQTIDDRFTTLEKRLRDMDEAGIDRQVISITQPGVDLATPDAAVRLAKLSNDELAGIMEADERFIGLAALPMLSPTDAVDELGRAVDLGLRGAGIFTNVQGKPLDHQEFWPVYEEASNLGVPLFIHPISPVNAEIYRDYRLLAVLGYPFETTHAATRLALSGLLEEYPDLVFVLSHMGGALPYLAGRIDDGNRIFRVHQDKIKRPPSESLKKMYLDAASFFEPALNCALGFWGAEKLLVGSDYPYGWVGDLRRCTDSIEDLNLDEGDTEKILHKNAERILKLKA